MIEAYRNGTDVSSYNFTGAERAAYYLLMHKTPQEVNEILNSDKAYGQFLQELYELRAETSSLAPGDNSNSLYHAFIAKLAKGFFSTLASQEKMQKQRNEFALLQLLYLNLTATTKKETAAVKSEVVAKNEEVVIEVVTERSTLRR